jgi:Uma2 family endonuclease
MATAELIGEQPPLLAVPPAGQRFVLRGLSWQQYRTIAQALTGRHLHLAFDRGNLELMTTSPLHGRLSRLVGHFIIALTEELGLPLAQFGDMTCGREDLEREIEPDECFYIRNAPRVQDRRELDLAVDPPPDLMVEIEISRSFVNRLGICAALGVPEGWRYDGETLRVHVRREDGTYALSERSLQFPAIPLDGVAAFLRRREEMDQNALVRAFRAWVREQTAPGATPPA